MFGNNCCKIAISLIDRRPEPEIPRPAGQNAGLRVDSECFGGLISGQATWKQLRFLWARLLGGLVYR
jgi:hypothetical protein